MAAFTNGGTPANPGVLREAWSIAVAELGQDAQHELDMKLLEKQPVDENAETAKEALRSVLDTIEKTAKKRGIDRSPSGTIMEEGPLKKIQDAFRRVANALETGAGAVMAASGPTYAGMWKKMGDTCEEANKESLAYLSDALVDGLDKMNEARTLLHNNGEIKAVREGVVRLHVKVLKFWACAARRMDDEKLAKARRDTYTSYISRESQVLHDFLAKQIKDINAAIDEAEKEAKRMAKDRIGAKSKLKAKDPNDTTAPTDAVNKHDSLRERWLEGTCKWITDVKGRECQQFNAWKDSSTSNMLWIHGAAGVGKTILAWYIIEKLLRDRVTGSEKLFFYCTHERVAAQEATAAEVLKFLVSQIFTRIWEDRPEKDQRFKLADRTMSDTNGVPDLITKFLATGGDTGSFDWLLKNDPPLSDMARLTTTLQRLLSALPGRRPVYIVIDGLDEYPDKQMAKLLRILRPLCAPPKSGSDKPLAKLLVLSRPTAYLVDINEGHGEPRGPGNRFEDFELPDDGVKLDVRAFLEAGISAFLQTLKYPSMPKEQIDMKTIEYVNQLVPMEKKTPPFQWAVLALDKIRGYLSLTHIENWLAGAKSEVPSLDAFYAGVLLRLESKLGEGMGNFIKSVLVWATYARKVLTTAELAELHKLQDPKCTEEWVYVHIKKYCGSLFRLQTMVNEDQHGVRQNITTLHFIHFSVAEFLRNWTKDSFEHLLTASELLAYRSDGHSHRGKDGGGDDDEAVMLARSAAHAKIFRDCIAYLQIPAFGESLVSIRGNATVKAKIEEKYGFFSYTAMWWTYHLVRVDAAGHVGECVKTLNDFFLQRGMKTWMEGILALNEGGEWFPTISAQIKNWLSTHGMWNDESCANFLSWVSDISSSGYRDYEQTLLHNNNEVHFVDERRLLPSITASQANSREDSGRDLLQALRRASDLDPDGDLMSLPPPEENTERSSLTSPLLPHACLRYPIFVGEDADNRFGFFSLDRNRVTEQGLLMIDKMSNHPRLVWERVSMSQRYTIPDEASIQSDNTRLTSVCSLLRDIDHSQFTTLSAALSDDGTMLAAVYREDCANQAIKLRLILWTFEGEKLDGWRTAVHDLVLQLSSSIAELHRVIDVVKQQEQQVKVGAMLPQPQEQSTFTVCGNIMDDESDEDVMTPPKSAPKRAPAVTVNRDLQTTAVHASMQDDCQKTVTENKCALIEKMHERVAVPSTSPLEHAKSWTSYTEILPVGGSKTAMQGNQQSYFASSPYLVAFFDPTTIILPCGRLSTSGSLLTEFPPGTLSESGATLTILPRGRFLLYASTDARGVEVVTIRPKAEPWVEKRHWSLSQCEGVRDSSNLRFTRVVDCSDSGHRVAIEVSGLPRDQVGFVLLELHNLEGRVIFCRDAEDKRFGISRVFFCPRDRHLLVVTEIKPESIGQTVYTLLMVDSHTTKVSMLGQTTKAPLAVAHFRCQEVGCAGRRGVDGQEYPSLMEQSISNTINLCVRDEILSSQPVSMQAPLYKCETTDRGIEECRIIRAEVGRDLARRLGSEAIYDALVSSSTLVNGDSDGPSGDTAITVVFADRSAKLLSLSGGNVVEGLDELPKNGKYYISATCKPSWVKDRVCAAYMSVTLVDQGPGGAHGHKVKLTLNLFSWALDLFDGVDKPLAARSIPEELKELDSVTETDLMCRGLSLSRNTEVLACWLGPNIWFLRQQTNSLTILKICPPPPKRLPNPLEVIFNQDDSFAAVLWSEPTASGDAKPRVRGSLLELYDLTGVNTDERIVLCGALEVDCDARAVHFHPMPANKPYLIITTANSILLYKYGSAGFSLVRRVDEEEVKTRLTIPNKTNGPASPKPTDETTVDIPIEGLAPLHFSTCGDFAFSEGWNCFASLNDLENPARRISGRIVIKLFNYDVIRVLDGFDKDAQTRLDHNLLEIRRKSDKNPNSLYTLREGDPQPQWTLPELHPHIMYDNVLYASGRHRFKIFRIRTYIVLGWSAEANNLFAHPVPKFTWYRRVLCAVPQSMSTWQATLIWPTTANPDHYLAVVLFPPPGGDVRLPHVIHTPLKFCKLQTTNIKKNDDDDDGWLRGHAFGCPYKLKAEKDEKNAKDTNQDSKEPINGGAAGGK